MLKRISLVVFFALLICSAAVAQNSILGTGGAGNIYTPASAGVMDVYTEPGGHSYFALRIAPQGVIPRPEAVDVVAVCDTSASITGDYKAQQEAALGILIGGLQHGDRIQLLATDTRTVKLSSALAGSEDPSVAKALMTLRSRVPLGANDMKEALTQAKACFDPNSPNARVVVFIGQGNSRANMLTAVQFSELGDQLAADKVSVNVIPVGANINWQNIGVLAAKTGGRVISPERGQAYEEVVQAVHEGVVWMDPSTDGVPAGVTVYPFEVLPLRADRDTVLIGDAGAKTVQELSAGLPFTYKTSEGKTYTYNVKPTVNPSFVFLKDAVDYLKDERNKGAWFPIVSGDDLALAMESVNANIESMNATVRMALENNNLEDAKKLVDKALERAPGNPESVKLSRMVDDMLASQRNMLVGGGASGGNFEDWGIAGMADDGGMLAGQVKANTAQEQVVRTETQKAINEARKMMATTPEIAVQDLKIKMEEVRSTEIRNELKDMLIDQIQAAVREGQARAEDLDLKEAEERAIIAQQRERQLAIEAAKTRAARITQQMKRFDSLMQEGNYRDAEENIAAEIANEDPDNLTAVTAVVTARTLDYHTYNQNMRAQKWKKTVEALAQVEKSMVPVPDEPPVIYPDADTWKRLTDSRRTRYSSTDLAQRGDAEKRIMEQLNESTTISANEDELGTVIKNLKDLHKIEIQLDTSEEAAVDPTMPITADLKGISLGAALRIMLGTHGFAFVVKDEVLLITSKDKADETKIQRVYPVADLVLPIDNGSMMDDMNTLMNAGGQNNGNQGWNQNNQGNNNNWMNVGNPVMNLNGVGGGMFCVEADLIITPREDDVNGSLQPSAPSSGCTEVSQPAGVNRSSSMASVGKKQKLSAIEKVYGKAPNSAALKPAPAVEVPSGVDKSVWWNEYFKALKDKSEDEVRSAHASVRSTVRELKFSRKYADMITVIEAALRNNQQETWMYEVLALAMAADSRPAEDVERAMMSAAEFCETPNDLLFIAVYMERLGLVDRALFTYKQLAQQFPTCKDPFIFAFKLASRSDVDNLDAIQWSALGIIRQEFPARYQPVWDLAYRKVKACVETLRAQGKDVEASQLEKDIQNALVRDCKVTVSWTGNADVDLFVEEPTGTICSNRVRRTAGGGYLLKDGFTRQVGRDGSIRASETYICSEGFSGEYHLIAKKVWGDVTSNKVQVEVVVHYRSGHEIVKKRSLPLMDDQVAVQFKLDNGRRTDPLENIQLETVAKRVVATSLAQKLYDSVDAKALRDFASSNDLPVTGRYAHPYLTRSGAVGYQPEITTLPTGTQLQATGVISADRCYVRVTPSPFFSSVPEVNKYNYNTGDDGGEEEEEPVVEPDEEEEEAKERLDLGDNPLKGHIRK